MCNETELEVAKICVDTLPKFDAGVAAAAADGSGEEATLTLSRARAAAASLELATKTGAGSAADARLELKPEDKEGGENTVPELVLDNRAFGETAHEPSIDDGSADEVVSVFL